MLHRSRAKHKNEIVCTSYSYTKIVYEKRKKILSKKMIKNLKKCNKNQIMMKKKVHNQLSKLQFKLTKKMENQ